MKGLKYLEIKVLSMKQMKIQPKSIEAYSIIVKELQKRDTKFHTYKPKHERSFRVVLKNIHPSSNTDKIKEAIDVTGP